MSNRATIFALAAMLAGCEAPTAPTPAAVRKVSEPEQPRMVTEVDKLASYSDPIDGECPEGMRRVRVLGVWMRGDAPVSDTVRVAKCTRGI